MEKEINVMTLNTWLAPSFPQIDERIRGIRGVIKDVGADIVLLQEVWKKEFLVKLTRGLGYHVTSFAGGDTNFTGLVTLSPKPESVSRVTFPVSLTHNPIERHVKKGFLCIRIGDVHVFNTHLYCPHSPTGFLQNKRQFDILKEATMQGNIILGGDLNIRKERFLRLNKNHFSYVLTGPSVERKNKWKQNWRTKLTPAEILLDYILVKGNVKIVSSKVLNSYEVSDHYPVVAGLVGAKLS